MFFSWVFFVVSQQFMYGIDAILRLKKGGWIGGYTSEGFRVQSVAQSGMPDLVTIILIGGIFFISVYMLLQALHFRNWLNLSIRRKLIIGGVLLINIALGVVVYIYMGWDYVIGTSIDSL